MLAARVCVRELLYVGVHVFSERAFVPLADFVHMSDDWFCEVSVQSFTVCAFIKWDTIPKRRSAESRVLHFDLTMFSLFR